MKFIIGFVVVIGCVLGGYVLHHGKLEVLWQPTEFLIIIGAAIGSFIIGTPGALLKDSLKSFKYLMKGMPYGQKDYTELLVMLSATFKTMRSKGMLEIEGHIEAPENSSIFKLAPKFLANHEATNFFCDYLRIMTMGMEDQYQLDDMMEIDLETHRGHGGHIEHAINNVADAMPALGIVAAVLGVIVTMGSITEPPEVLGKLIGAALVGTFLGVLVSYGLMAPMARYIGSYYTAKVKYIEVIKVALLAHVKGNAPVISVEFARNSIDDHDRPAFKDVEAALAATPAT
ncbi:MAG: flagellar motor stator protein MotA [Alphaproteobacteria bacterium]|nr:flagellar motor stator protein MotA [Alphaproteobacteria bacterium]